MFSWRGDDRGETLVEVLVTIVILGIAGVAVLAGLELTVKSSDLGRKQATGGAYVRSLAEAIQNSLSGSPTGYKPCTATTPNYLSGAVLTAAGLPGGYTPTVTGVQAWNGSSWVTCNGSSENGTQRLSLKVTSAGTSAHLAVEQLTLVIRNPCSGVPGASACA